jgi:hypothetical protein
LKVPAGVPSVLDVTYWGEEAQPRKFDIYLNDHLLATQELFRAHPGHFFDRITSSSRNGCRREPKGSTVEVVIRFAVLPDGFKAGGIYGLRILPALN